MASNPPSVFKIPDRYLIRLRKMSESGSRRALHKILKWVNPNWTSSVSFKEYIKNETNISMKTLNSILNPHQRKLLREDQQGDAYDISLLFILISRVNVDLAEKSHDSWHTKETPMRLEYLITAVKEIRNSLSHSYEPLDKQKFLERTRDLRNLLEELYTTAGSRYNHVSQLDVTSSIQEMNDLIDRISVDPLDPQEFDDYKNQLLFSQQCDFVKVDGALALRTRHGKYSSLTPVSRLVKSNFRVGNVFTEMLVRQASDLQEKIELQDLLDTQQEVSDGLILIVGDAGIGKTTLTKKILSDWILKTSSIRHIDSFDLVIHAECREHIESFKGLLDCSMLDVSKNFQREDIVFVTMALKSLIIVDGLDELNRKSVKLFKEILKLKKDHELTVIATSRPEAIEKYFQLARLFQVETKQIELLGIPVERREEFVTKYFDGIDKTGLITQSIDGLLKYLKRTLHRLGYLWRSPYNLCVLTILWTLQPDVINSISTAPELHWEIHKLSLSKLKERLMSNEATQHLTQLQLERKISTFLFKLCRESLVAIVDDNVTLPQEAYQRLVDACHEIDIPAEEMNGAFLKQVSTDSGIRYSFPHKGLQDFFAALFIWMRLTATPQSADVQNVIKGFNDVLANNSISYHSSQCILTFAEKLLTEEASKKAAIDYQQSPSPPENEGSSLINQNPQNIDTPSNQLDEANRITSSFLRIDNVPQEIRQAVCEVINDRFKSNPKYTANSSGNTPLRETEITKIILEETSVLGLLPEMSKFQNMFISLLGIFYMNTNANIKDETREEVLNLLEKSGVKGKDAWLNILNSVRCDTYVATFISKEPKIMEGNIIITDSTLFAYISLMQALAPSLKQLSNLLIDIEVKGDLTGAEDLLKLISLHQYKIRSILMNEDNFTDYANLLKSLTTPLKESHEVMVDLQINLDLLDLKDLMTQIRRHTFLVRTLEVKDCHVKDSHFMDFASLLKCLPTISSDACQMSLNLDVAGDITCFDEFLLLINNHNLKLKNILVSDMNILQYTEYLKSLKTPLRDPHEVNFSIDLEKNESVAELLHEIAEGGYSVKLLKIKDCQVSDSNCSECLRMLRSFPVLSDNANQTNVDIVIRGNLMEGKALFDLLIFNGFRVSSFLVAGNNLEAYTVMLREMEDPWENAQEVNVHIDADKKLTEITELMEEVKKKEFRVAKLHLNDILITDSNVMEVASVLKSFPHISEDANKTSIEIGIHGSPSYEEQLLKIISENFIVKSMLVTWHNIKEYTKIIASCSTMKNFHDLTLKIQIVNDIFCIKELITEITETNINVSSIQLKTTQVKDSNLKEFIQILKNFPLYLKEVHKCDVILAISGDLNGSEELLELIHMLQFTVREMYVTDANVKQYSEMMEALPTPLKSSPNGIITVDIKGEILHLPDFFKQADMHHLPVKKISMYDDNYIDYIELVKSQAIQIKLAPEVNAELHITLISPHFCELIASTQKAQLPIGILHLDEELIDDTNICKYIKVLKCLPKLPKKSINGTLVIRLNEGNSTFGELLEELRKNPFLVEIKLPNDFKNPTSQLVWRDNFNKLQRSQCILRSYEGALVRGMIVPKHHLVTFDVSIADTGGYKVLEHVLNFGSSFISLRLCLSHRFPSYYDMRKLPSHICIHHTILYIADVVEETVKNASAFVRRFYEMNMPYSPFKILGFPRAALDLKGMEDLMTKMKGIDTGNLIFPSNCQPPSKSEEEELQRLAKRTLGCDIFWSRDVTEVVVEY